MRQDMSNEHQTPAAASGAVVSRPCGMRVCAAEVSAVRDEDREVDFICSTDSLDSYNETVRQNWRLDRFKKNPVALFAHQSRELPIGQWRNVRVEKDALCGTFKCATAAANPLAENVWQSLKEKTLRAVSVGFRPGKVLWEEHDGKDVCVLDDNELMEISVVPLPANPDAVIDEMKARAKSAFDEQRAKNTKPTAPVATTKEAAVADENKTTDSELHTKLAAEALRATRAETAAAEKDATISRLTAEKDAVVAKATADLATANDRCKGLSARVREAEILPLIGVRIAPTEKDGCLEFGAYCDSLGAAGEAKWKGYLDGLSARPEMKMLGKSQVPADPTPTGLTTAGADPLEDSLLAGINAN